MRKVDKKTKGKNISYIFIIAIIIFILILIFCLFFINKPDNEDNEGLSNVFSKNIFLFIRELIIGKIYSGPGTVGTVPWHGICLGYGYGYGNDCTTCQTCVNNPNEQGKKWCEDMQDGNPDPRNGGCFLPKMCVGGDCIRCRNDNDCPNTVTRTCQGNSIFIEYYDCINENTDDSSCIAKREWVETCVNPNPFCEDGECRPLPKCGNGNPDPGEKCDIGFTCSDGTQCIYNEASSCNYNPYDCKIRDSKICWMVPTQQNNNQKCRLRGCGDSVVELNGPDPTIKTDDEECDTGDMNTQDCWMQPNEINIYGLRCRKRNCGDGIKELPGPDENIRIKEDNEQCDEGHICKTTSGWFMCDNVNPEGCLRQFPCAIRTSTRCWMNGEKKCRDRGCGDGVKEINGPDRDTETLPDNEDCDLGKFCSDLNTSCDYAFECENQQGDKICKTRNIGKCRDNCCEFDCSNNACPDLVKAKCGDPPNLQVCNNNQDWTIETDNFDVSIFEVSANSGYIVCSSALLLEYNLCKIAVELTGDKITLDKKIPVLIQISSSDGEGGTSVDYNNCPPDDNPPCNINIDMIGNEDFIFNIAIPHEIDHVIIYHMIDKLIPKWVREGLATNSESNAEKCIRYKYIVNALTSVPPHTYPLTDFFTRMEYPPGDTFAFYGQSYSLAEFLIKRGGGDCNAKKRLLDMVLMAFNNGNTKESWEQTLRQYYGINSINELRDLWINDVRKQMLKNCNACSCLTQAS